MAGERVHTQGEPVWVRTRGGRALYAMVLPGPAGAPGVPTVVFEAGSAATRSTWASVQTRVAAFTRAVVYDRAGLGRSVPDSAGHTLDRMADDLNDLLDGLEPSSGFVQVGHSAGGPMVLVDPTDEAATQQFGVPFRVGEKIVIAVEWVLARVGLLERFFRFLGEGMPEDVRADLHREACRPAVVVTQGRQARTFLTELHAWRGDPPVLPDVPVTVISGSLADGMPRRVRDAATAAGRYRAAQSRQGRHVVAARSGHYIPATESDLIAAEIRRLVLPPVG
ncbi:alpha/beta fold hydrolase [Microbacterium sp. MRS-1]|uniref:alpha/beta fold hydrolase n=1 Tax=Microbacterium sp. MRS-1 TaxID=1451261 RepID=UPI00056621DE|nr:alpha/beta hydrolase [Microbacterium sp. MRS-1]